VCFYHLVYTGRGAGLAAQDLAPGQTRRVVDEIVDFAAEVHAAGEPREVLTVDNHADGPYIYLRMVREGHPRADRALELLRLNGGISSGLGIGCVSWDGTVFPDQFWRNHPLGNVRQQPFSEIWTDLSNPFLARLRNRRKHIRGRCATCRFLDACGGNFRARAEAVTGDPWAPDPACYLTDAEIGVPVEAEA
jgi:radical SAM protein with 4Fe4S-binding SPASM domain